MKAALNGVPQLSTADGWWAEGYNGHNGWTIATPAVESDAPETNAAAAGQLYSLLEQEVVPTYYTRDSTGMPRQWIAMMKQAMRVAGLQFTARRMLIEYVRTCYVPSITGDPVPDAPPTA